MSQAEGSIFNFKATVPWSLWCLNGYKRTLWNARSWISQNILLANQEAIEQGCKRIVEGRQYSPLVREYLTSVFQSQWRVLSILKLQKSLFFRQHTHLKGGPGDDVPYHLVGILTGAMAMMTLFFGN